MLAQLVGDGAAGFEQWQHDGNDVVGPAMVQVDDLELVGERREAGEQRQRQQEESPAGGEYALDHVFPRNARCTHSTSATMPSGSWSGRQTRRTSRPSL